MDVRGRPARVDPSSPTTRTRLVCGDVAAHVKVAFVVGLLVAGALLAGCATPDANSTGTTCVAAEGYSCAGSRLPPPPGDMIITGLVQSNALVPLAAANVSISELGLHVVTDAYGRFTLPGIQPSIYNVEAEHPGFARSTMVARPEVTSLQFILDRAAPTQPYNVTLPPLHGFLECASEEFIGSGSCDLYIQYVGGPPVFQNASAFLFEPDLGWKTMVLDLDFDSSNNPGIDGLRATLRGANASASLGTYEQYGRFYGKTSFSIRIEPGLNYTDGTAPVPANVTAFKLEIYPQGRGYHEACHPGVPGYRPPECFLGAGIAINLRFDLYISIFYVDPAPTGFTLLDA